MHNRKPAIAIMALTAILLAGFGYGQFSHLDLLDAEQHSANPDETQEWVQRIVRERGGRLLEVEREYAGERVLYEIELMDAEGRRQELLVDRQTGEIVREEY